MVKDLLFTVGQALPTDANDFANLIILSAPTLFPRLYGPRVRALMARLFTLARHRFSFQHVHFAESEGERAGMLLGYDWRSKGWEDWRTGWLLWRFMGGEFFRRLPLFLQTKGRIGQIAEGEYYISNLAVYPAHRGKGIGTALLLMAEESARASGAARITLDVEVENQKAVRLYRRMGYAIAQESSVRLRDRVFRFYRMGKALQ